jgi:hypothetical protein
MVGDLGGAGGYDQGAIGEPTTHFRVARRSRGARSLAPWIIGLEDCSPKSAV